MWSRLAEHAHLVAIDLPGFGHSERRDELLTPSAMGEFVARVVREFGLKRPHAVGPDIGTSTLLFAAAKHPGLLRSIVLGNGTAAVPLQIGSVLKDVVEAPSLEPLRNIDPRKSVESVLAFVESYKLPDHVCHRSVQNRPVIIESKPATFMVSKGFEVTWQVASH
jgi:pimeloyl-ACP methyl ester carboxylesterase